MIHRPYGRQYRRDIGGGQPMCSGSEAGSYLRLNDFVYHSTLGLRLIKKKKRRGVPAASRSSARSPGRLSGHVKSLCKVVHTPQASRRPKHNSPFISLSLHLSPLSLSLSLALFPVDPSPGRPLSRVSSFVFPSFVRVKLVSSLIESFVGPLWEGYHESRR